MGYGPDLNLYFFLFQDEELGPRIPDIVIDTIIGKSFRIRCHQNHLIEALKSHFLC